MKAGRHHPCTPFWPHYNLARIPRKELIHSQGSPVYATVTQGMPPHLVRSPAEITIADPQDHIYLHTLKAECQTSNQDEKGC